MEKICKVEGCENECHTKGYCRKHYCQIWKYGKILKRTKFDPNEIIDCEDYYEICLYKGNGEQIEVARTKIDKDDLKKVKDYKWSLSKGYVRNGKIKIKLHQLVLGKKEGYEIDHKNTNKLDNRKQNLRFATRSQNSMNRKNKGYSFDKNRNSFQVNIMLNKKNIHIGRFPTEQQAIQASKQAKTKYFGEFLCK